MTAKPLQNDVNQNHNCVTISLSQRFSFASSKHNQTKTNVMQQQPKTVEYLLEASAFDWEVASGKTVPAWGFNNQVPGPLLKAHKGDTLVVKVKNSLPEPTIVHWHGIRLPASMDGTDGVQKPIQPGETFEYRFVVPDGGTFWYHSHHNETVQVERGLYGGIIIEEETALVTDAEKVFLIDDMKLTVDGQFKHGGFIARWMERHDGRQGNTRLINGKEEPIIKMQAGQVERWHFINTSSARYFQFHLDGRPFKLIGTDGGFLEHPRTETELLLTPGERIDIVVGPFAAGERFPLESLAYNRTTFLKAKRETFATVIVGVPKPSMAFIPDTLRQIEPLAPQDAEVTRRTKLSVSPSLKHGIDFQVNGVVHANDNPVIVGDLQVWEVANTSLMDHPFHLHGFFFQVLEENGKAPEYRAWKDTVNLKPKSKVKIAWMPDNRPGVWMYHCHILEHHAAGMMAHFEVIDGNKPYTKIPRSHTHTHHIH
jgi:FtsP/CotA-like multicopper oxidase with cupredoxin domain